MNSKLIKIFLLSSLIAQSVFLGTAHSADRLSQLANYRADSTDANNINRYALPRSKVYLESCQRKALSLHPGVIEKQRTWHRHGDFLVRYEIQDRDGFAWFILCDLATGRILDVF